MTITVTPLETYRNDTPYPFCPGCGHGTILDALDEALRRLGRPPEEVVIVSDIGCAGLSDQYFGTSAFHGLHGRSVTYATGIKLARPELEVVVIMGDGGTGIGGTHLVNAARRNVGITVLVFNNMNFGMTGGQHSTTTPEGSITSTTPGGNLEHPLDICGTVGVNGAAYVYRGTSFDADLVDCIVDAIRTPGFSLMDIWELCTAYFMPNNKIGKKGLDTTMGRLGFDRGVLVSREVAEYGDAYRRAAAEMSPRRTPTGFAVEYASTVGSPIGIVVAGSAGAKVRSASRLLGEAAIRSGLWATQRGDYPVTVKSGHSVTELLLGPSEMPPVPVGIPDIVVLVSEDGLKKVRSRLTRMDAGALVVTVPEFANVDTPASVAVVDPSAVKVPKGGLALALITVSVVRTGIVDVEALRAAAAGPFERDNLAAIDAGITLAG
jgi:pyruvate/2-oxoacid:ferredoxin oxidoreductase beta subunit/Pyruvate/2-oxoacid:ferredoxin oxidoreductase gamma subunit